MKTKSLEVILAATPRGEIGYKNTIPWRLKGDLKRFKELTKGNVVIMGRKTYESLPAPLADRTVIIVSTLAHIGNYPSTNNCAIYVARSLIDAIVIAEGVYGEKVFVAGGVRLYEEALRLNDITVHLTLVHKPSADGYDAVIPNFNLKNFELAPTRFNAAHSYPVGLNTQTVYDVDPETNIPVPSHTYLTYRSKTIGNSSLSALA